MSDQSSGGKPRPVLKDAAAKFLAACKNLGNLDNAAVDSLSAVLEILNCKTESWDFAACGIDLKTPEMTRETINTTGANKAATDQHGNQWEQLMPSVRAALGPVDLELYLTKKQWLMWVEWFLSREIRSVRAVDATKEFVAYNAFVTSISQEWPGGAGEAAIMPVTIQPTGAPFIGSTN